MVFVLNDGSDYELIVNGGNTQLTIENIDEYIELIMSGIFNDGVKLQL